jgi:hypothetical protein
MKKGRREILIMGGPVGDPDMANVNHGAMCGILFLLLAGLRIINSQR